MVPFLYIIAHTHIYIYMYTHIRCNIHTHTHVPTHTHTPHTHTHSHTRHMHTHTTHAHTHTCTETLDTSFKHAYKADLCVALGSSLTVTPAAQIPAVTSFSVHIRSVVKCHQYKWQWDDKCNHVLRSSSRHSISPFY